MDIQKSENFKCFIVITICVFSGVILANNDESLSVLKESYQISERDDYLSIIEKLQNAYQKCNDPFLKERLLYRLGIVCFKAGDLKRAYDQFLPLATDENDSAEIRIASINMVAQTARMQGHDGQALEYYDKLIHEITEIARKSDKAIVDSTIEELYISSVFGKAEIYTFQKKYVEVAHTYTLAIQFLEDGFIEGLTKYLPVLYDRLSQSHFKADNLQDYRRFTSLIVEKYSDYDRATLVKLESFAVRFLTENNIEWDESSTSLDAPARLILYVKDHKDSQDTANVEALFNQLSRQSVSGYGRWLTQYHQAWFLDAIGKREDACRLFGEIIAGIEADKEAKNDCVTDTILAYSELQKALMDGEYKRYKEGLACVDLIKNDMKNVHISKLSDSIRNSLEILKREVPKDENAN